MITPVPPEVIGSWVFEEYSRVYRRATLACETPRAGIVCAAAAGDYGITLHAGGFLAEAEVQYDLAARLDPGNYQWPYLASHAARGRLDTATQRRYLSRAHKLAPGDPSVNFWFGKSLADDRPDQARARLKQAVEVDHEHAPAMLQLARIELQAGDAALAMDWLDRAASLQPHARELIPVRTRALYRLNREAEARQLAAQYANVSDGRKMLMADPIMNQVRIRRHDARSLLQRGRREMRAGEIVAAVQTLERALQAGPRRADVQVALATALSAAGQAVRAVELLDSCLSLRPEYQPALAARAQLARRRGEWELAIELENRLVLANARSGRRSD